MPTEQFNDQETERSYDLDKKLDLNYAKKLLFYSYQFSQGDASLQNMIFDYIHITRPNWRLSSDDLEKLASEFTQIARKFVKMKKETNAEGKFTEHSSIDVDNIEDDVLSSVTELGDALSEDDVGVSPDKEKTIDDITKRMIDRDWMFISRLEGRPNKNRPDVEKPMTDPYFSYFVFYILKEQNTNVLEFDEMLGEVREYVFSRRFEDSEISLTNEDKNTQGDVSAKYATKTIDYLQRVIKLYNQHHPESPVNFEEFKKQKNNAK